MPYFLQFRGDRQVLVVFHHAILFATFFQKKLGQNPSARYYAQKVAYFEEIDKFWWFFTKCHTFFNIFLKIGSKPQCTVLCTKSCKFRGDRQVLVVFHQMPYFFQHFSKNWVKTLVHATLHKKLLISRRSTSFGGFSPNAILFATFF